MEKVDYLIRNGHLIDCYQNISREKDIAVKNGNEYSVAAKPSVRKNGNHLSG